MTKQLMTIEGTAGQGRQRWRIMNQKGQALVELALSIFLLLLLVMGIFEFGRAMYIKNTLNNAARAGARAAVVTPVYDVTTNPTGLQATTSSVSLNNSCSFNGANKDVLIIICRSIYNGVPKNEVSVDIVINDLNSSGTINNGDQVLATVTWNNFQLIVPKIFEYFGAKITNSLVGQASMRYE